MSKTIGIMQPYLFPYLGYFQLINATDAFIIYDNIKYTKKGWINRNRFNLNGHPAYFGVPLKNASDTLNINQRFISSDYDPRRLINQLSAAYRKTPFFDETFPLIEKVATEKKSNLFDFLYAGLQATCCHLALHRPLLTSSCIDPSPTDKAQARVIRLCQLQNATRYINPIGGKALYDGGDFARHGLDLMWLQPELPSYPQPHTSEFIPALSILDVLCCVGKEQALQWIHNCHILQSAFTNHHAPAAHQV